MQCNVWLARTVPPRHVPFFQVNYHMGFLTNQAIKFLGLSHPRRQQH